MYFLSAVGAGNVAHVFNQCQYRHIHHFSHINGFFNNHAYKFLRRGNYNNAVHGNGLEYRQRHVAGAGRHINKHVVNIAPDYVRPKLFDDAGNQRAAPYNRVGFVFYQKVKRHNADACGGFYREQSPFACLGVAVQAKSPGDGRACDIGIHNCCFIAFALSQYCQKRGYERFADAAFAADYAYYFFYVAHFVRFFQKTFFCTFAAIFGAAFAVMRAVFNHLLCLLLSGSALLPFALRCL